MSTVRLVGWCPACGMARLHATAGGVIWCDFPGCPRPHAAHDVLSDSETGHTVTSHDDGTFTLRHPLAERLDGGLEGCDAARIMARLSPGDLPPGRYRISTDVIAGLLAAPANSQPHPRGAGPASPARPDPGG